MTLDELNVVCAEIAREEQELYLSQQINAMVEDLEIEMLNEETQKQYEMMSYDADAEYYGEMV